MPSYRNVETVVRVFEQPDAEAVVALWANVFPDDPPRNEPRAMLARKLSQDDGLVWLAESGGAIVGVVMAGYDGVRGWIYHLAVHADHRRKGIATALVRAAEAELAARGCPKVNLQFREVNAGLLAFYEGLGYSRDAVVSMGRALGGTR